MEGNGGNKMLEVLLGQIPEAIYFALFMIFVKQLKEKRVLFIILMIAEYLLLKVFIKYNMWFQISYTFMNFLILKLLYKEKAQITDIFTFTISSIVLILISFVSYFIIWKTIGNYLIAAIINRLLLIIFLLITHKKLYNIQKLYKKLWNRQDNKKHKVKSTTFRAINVVVFNLLFFIINLGIIFTFIIGRSV